jgi:hypothetical protein
MAEKCRRVGSCSYLRDLGFSIHRAESSWVHGRERHANPDRLEIMNPDQSALEVRGLTKRFDRPAVDAPI